MLIYLFDGSNEKYHVTLLRKKIQHHIFIDYSRANNQLSQKQHRLNLVSHVPLQRKRAYKCILELSFQI